MSRFSVPQERAPPVSPFSYDFSADEMLAVWIPKDALAVDVRHGGVEGKIRPLVVVAERNAVVVEEHFRLAESQRLMDIRREDTAHKIDRTAMVLRVFWAPWAEMAVMVVDEHVEMTAAVAVDGTGRQRMEHDGLVVAVAQHFCFAPCVPTIV